MWNLERNNSLLRTYTTNEYMHIAYILHNFDLLCGTNLRLQFLRCPASFIYLVQRTVNVDALVWELLCELPSLRQHMNAEVN